MPTLKRRLSVPDVCSVSHDNAIPIEIDPEGSSLACTAISAAKQRH